MARQGNYEPGDGHLYNVFSDDCYQAMIAGVNDPNFILFEYLDEDGIDKNAFLSALRRMKWSEEYQLWYDPDYQNNDVWSDAVMAFTFFSEEIGLDCEINAQTLLLSTQGVGGM